MHDVSIDGRHRPVPASWNELTRPLLLQLAPVLYAGAESDAVLRLRVLRVVLQISWATLLTFTDVQLAQLVWLADFALAEVTLTTQLLPSLQLPRRKDPLRRHWWGPRERFRNLRFLEFIFADAYFVAFSQDPAYTQLLDQLVAVLYRPQRRPYEPQAVDYDGDRREPFNPVHLAARAQRLAHLPLPEKLAVLTWYRGCRVELERDYPDVFTPANEESAAGASDGWAHVAREMSGGIFGTLEQTERQLVRDVLARMNDDALRAKALREQAEAQQTAC